MHRRCKKSRATHIAHSLILWGYIKFRVIIGPFWSKHLLALNKMKPILFLLFALFLMNCTTQSEVVKVNQMNHNPLLEVVDEPLLITPQAIQQLTILRETAKFNDLPGNDIVEEKERLSKVLDKLLDELIAGVSNNPRKIWVMRHLHTALQAVEMEDTEGREHFGVYLEQVMDILNIKSSDGLLNFYL